MAHNQYPFAHRQSARATALVGMLGLACLPVAASAQMSGPGMGRRMNSAPPANRSMPAPPMTSRPGGGYHPYEHPAIPGYGASFGYLHGGNPFNPGGFNNSFNNSFNRSGSDYNAMLQRLPGGAYEYGSGFVPNQAPDFNVPNQSRNINPGQVRAFSQSHGRVQRPGVPLYNQTRYNRYANGSWERRPFHIYGSWGSIYFPGGSGYYPYYAPDYAYGLTGPSIYYYYGTFPPYIGLDQVYQDPPQYDYVPNPVYTPEGQYQGNSADNGQGYDRSRQAQNSAPPQSAPGQYKVNEGAGRADRSDKDALVMAAVADIAAAWHSGDIETLSKHIRPNARVAVYLRGKYQYSLDGGDYLDMTRDALRATKTMTFTLNDVKRKDNGVYTVNGRHTYQDKDGRNHTVLVTYVLAKTDNEYYITQIGTAPEKLEE